jgi:hypothetical protein
MENKKQMTLTEFMYKTIVRKGDTAELIFDNFEGNPNKPVRLIGFSCPSYLSDFEIRELGYMYFQDLVYDSEEMRREQGQ